MTLKPEQLAAAANVSAVELAKALDERRHADAVIAMLRHLAIRAAWHVAMGQRLDWLDPDFPTVPPERRR